MPPSPSHPILLVDDSLVFLKVLGAVFTKAGYEVATARTGVEALVRAMEEPFAAVISDCHMPIMTGFELCRLLKDDPITNHLPVILITGTEHRMGRLWSRTCGADRFWIKRENYDHLVGVVRDLTGLRKKRHAGFQPPPQISMEDIQRRMSEVLERSVMELSLRHTIGSIGTKHQSLGGVAWPFLDLAYDLISPGALYCVLPTWEGHRAFGIHSRGIDPRALEAQIGAFHWVHGEVQWEWKDYPSQDPPPMELIHTPAHLELAGGEAQGQWGYLVEAPFPTSCVELLDIAQEEFLKVLQASVAVDMLRGAIRDLDHANEAKTEYVQTLCHEIRNPLSAAMGSLELAQASEIPGSAGAKNLSRAMDAMERQLYLLNVVLDVEKLEAHGTELRFMEVDVEALVRRAFALMEGAAGKKAVYFQILTHGEPPWTLESDPDRLLQCLTNLLGNAIKFTPSGTTVTVALSKGIGILRLEVRDQGDGLPEGFEDRIFGKFQQAGEIPGGTGLGLSITRRLVEALGGVVGVRSRPKEGATFWMDLPTRDAGI